ncbi:Hypothetical_protein [Hexamita inflata]|uniref:Hypothetical_protein n=1 Tax=Hexamita inflata TaxID=28002 RepID=A0AA86R1Y0_9EUKA|nr:Hypothetical protein HINF_LOCUS55287 [Hexamita inflata]
MKTVEFRQYGGRINASKILERILHITRRTKQKYHDQSYLIRQDVKEVLYVRDQLQSAIVRVDYLFKSFGFKSHELLPSAKVVSYFEQIQKYNSKTGIHGFCVSI